MFSIIDVDNSYKEITFEFIYEDKRIGIVLDEDGTSSWFVVNNSGYSESGLVAQVAKFREALTKLNLKGEQCL